MAARLAWVLNLDADLELGASGSYAPRKSVAEATIAHAQILARSLLGPDDVLVDPASPGGRACGLVGRAFCPTPRALAALRRAGAEPEPHPPVAVLRLVNSRAFASSLGDTLEGAAFVRDLTAAAAMLATEPPVGRGWRVKHPFGMAGRNQRIIVPSRIDDRDRSFLERGMLQGGLQIEPNVSIEQEYAVHGFIGDEGSVRIGALVRQRCDAHGAWVASERAPMGDPAFGDVPARIAREAHLVADALLRAGFFGPFGVDAYTYRDPHGHLRLQPRSEINARYCMGYATGWDVGWDAAR